jgi:hypothetical protein
MTLPWIVAPRQNPPRRVGTLDSGILEIPVLGGLTVEEADTIAALSVDDVSAFVQGAQLADAIAKAEEISISEAFAIVEEAINGRATSEQAEAIRLRYASGIEAVTLAYAAAGQRDILASVTAVIRHRLGPLDWVMPVGFPRVLVNDIWQLVRDEQAAEKLPTNRPTEEELGKQPPAAGRRKRRTGTASSGACAMPSQVPSVETPSAES